MASETNLRVLVTSQMGFVMHGSLLDSWVERSEQLYSREVIALAYRSRLTWGISSGVPK
jgi:hypothetical protein